MADPKPLLEYVTISFVSGSHGQNVTITPKRPDTETAVEAAKIDGLAGALNKLAEYGLSSFGR